jgi:hypothetical protein
MTLDLSRLGDLEKAATSAPWLAYFTSHGDPYVLDGTGFLSHQIAKVDTAPDDYGRANNELIVALRNAAPELLALARRGERLGALLKEAKPHVLMTTLMEPDEGRPDNIVRDAVDLLARIDAELEAS